MAPHVVLMIDDEQDDIDRVSRYLDCERYQLLCTVDPFEGMEMARQLQPDIIILDIKMGELDGYEVCRRLSNHTTTRHIPIIIYSNLASQDEVYVLSLGLGAHTVVEKNKLVRLGAVLERFLAEQFEETSGRLCVYRCCRQGHELRMQADAERVWLDGIEKYLRPMGRKLLAFLAERPGVVVPSSEIVAALYPPSERFGHGPEDIHRLVHDVRKEIEPLGVEPLFLLSKPRKGYLLSDQDEGDLFSIQ